jgi:hypothetical protein
MNTDDGPIPPDKFAFGGTIYPLVSPLVWRLLHHVWKSPSRQASVDSLAKAVWEDATHSVSYLAVASLRRNANRFFKTNNLPFMMRTSQEAVFVVVKPSNKDTNND